MYTMSLQWEHASEQVASTSLRTMALAARVFTQENNIPQALGEFGIGHIKYRGVVVYVATTLGAVYGRDPVFPDQAMRVL